MISASSMGLLFLLLKWGTAFRRLSIEYNLFLGLGRIFSQKLGVQVCLPSHIGTLDKRQCMHRLPCIRPNQRQRWFRVCPVSWVVLWGPRLCVRCVHLRLFDFSENQDLSAKTFTTSSAGKREILGFLLWATQVFYDDFCNNA